MFLLINMFLFKNIQRLKIILVSNIKYMNVRKKLPSDFEKLSLLNNDFFQDLEQKLKL